MFGSSNITVGDFTGRPADASPAATALALIVDPATDTMSVVELQNLPVQSGVVLQDGTAGLAADWDAGSHQIRAETFQSDVATGTAPLTVASTTLVANLNADQLDGQEGSYYATAADVATNTADIATNTADIATNTADVAALTSGQNRLRTVIARVDNTAAPPTEVEGDRYLLDDTGASHANWDGAAINDVVQFTSGSWVATNPLEGFVVYSDGSNTDWLYVDDGTPDWTERSVASTDHGSLSGLGDDDHPHYGKKAGETWTGAHDFGGADSVELPNSAAPTVDAAGELALDTDVADWTGLFKYHDGTEELTILALPTGNMVATDQFGFVYDAAADEIVMQGVLTPYLDNGDTLGGALAGDTVYHDGTTWTNRRKGTDGQVWTMVAGFPDWAAAASGVQNKYDATTAPVVGDDSAAGYSVGSHWIDITNDAAYICLDATAGAAVWQEIGHATHTHTSTAVTDFETATNNIMDARASAGLARVVATSDVTINTKDISTLAYASDSVSVIANPNCCEISPNGLRLYVTTTSFADVRSYDLSVAWDVSTAVVDYSRTLPVEISDPAAVRFKPDGTQMFVLDQDDEHIYTFNCLTEWLPDTATFETEKLDTSSEGSASSGFFINPDGDRVFVLKQSSDTVKQYNLTTPWDMSTGSYASKEKDVSSENTQPQDITFTADGLTMYMVGTLGDTIYQYNLTTAWDISTASYSTNSKSHSAEDGHITGLALGNDDKNLLCSGTINDKVYRYDFKPGAPGAIDGVTLADGDRVLLAGQTVGAENGIWTAATALQPETWTRPADMSAADSVAGRLVKVTAGNTYTDTLWTCTAASGSDVVGTDAVTFTVAMTTPLNNYAGTTAPGVGDDSADGYGVGSNWYDTTNEDAYVCLDPTAGAAVWKKTTP